MLGILGIVFDKRKSLAIAATVLAAGSIVLIASLIVISIVMNA